MGCDIHLHIEIKLDGVWEHYAAPDVNRNYRLFERMGGVRGDENNAISPPKGLPADASKITRLEFKDEGYYHTPSWLSSAEIIQLESSIQEWHKDRYDHRYDPQFEVFHCHYRYHPGDDFRFVFWFDN
jgi:hypothetical protein